MTRSKVPTYKASSSSSCIETYAYILFSPFSSSFFLSPFLERHGLTDPKRVETLQTKVINSLKDHVTYNPDAQKKQQYFTRILDRLPALRSLSVQGLQRIFYLKLEDLVPAPPLIEKMFASTIPF